MRYNNNEADEALLPTNKAAQPSKLKVLSVWLALFAIQIASAGYSVIAQEALEQKVPANPLVFSFLRDGLSAPILILCAVIFEGRTAVTNVLTPSNIPRLFLCGLFGMFGNQFCYILGLVFISATLASVVNLLTSVFTWCFAVSIGLEQFSFVQAFGVFLSVGGAMIMCKLLEPETYEGKNNNMVFGALSVVGSCIFSAIYYIILKPLACEYAPISLTAWCYVFGAFVMALPTLLYVPWSSEWASNPDPLDHTRVLGDAWQFSAQTWRAVAVAVIVNSILKYGLTTFANGHVSVTVLAIFGTLVPVFTYVFELIAGQSLPWTTSYLGGLGVLAGLAIMVWKRSDDYKPDPTTLSPFRRRFLHLCAGIRTRDDDDDDDDDEEDGNSSVDGTYVYDDDDSDLVGANIQGRSSASYSGNH